MQKFLEDIHKEKKSKIALDFSLPVEEIKRKKQLKCLIKAALEFFKSDKSPLTVMFCCEKDEVYTTVKSVFEEGIPKNYTSIDQNQSKPNYLLVSCINMTAFKDNLDWLFVEIFIL